MHNAQTSYDSHGKDHITQYWCLYFRSRMRNGLPCVSYRPLDLHVLLYYCTVFLCPPMNTTYLCQSADPPFGQHRTCIEPGEALYCGQPKAWSSHNTHVSKKQKWQQALHLPGIRHNDSILVFTSCPCPAVPRTQLTQLCNFVSVCARAFVRGRRTWHISYYRIISLILEFAWYTYNTLEY